jgi:aspartate carbamoyltransferase catalytic subunit
MKQDILDYLNRHNVWYTLESDFNKILPEVDVVYLTRIEEEKIPAASIEKPFKRYFVDEEAMKLMRSNAILMHPLPRLNEISPAGDTDPRSAYFRQTKNGVLIRMALLASVLE